MHPVVSERNFPLIPKRHLRWQDRLVKDGGRRRQTRESRRTRIGLDARLCQTSRISFDALGSQTLRIHQPVDDEERCPLNRQSRTRFQPIILRPGRHCDSRPTTLPILKAGSLHKEKSQPCVNGQFQTSDALLPRHPLTVVPCHRPRQRFLGECRQLLSRVRCHDAIAGRVPPKRKTGHLAEHVAMQTERKQEVQSESKEFRFRCSLPSLQQRPISFH